MNIWPRAAAAFVLACIASACGLGPAVDRFGNVFTNSTTEAVNAIDDAVDVLESASADWQRVLQELTSKLTDDAQSTLRNEIANLASRTIAQGGVELRCSADFIGTRVRQALLRIKATFLGQNVPEAEPSLCQVVPLAVDRALVPSRLKQIEFYGYDFDHGSELAVYLESADGPRRNITSALDRPTHYAMTLRFGANGVQLDGQSSRFVLQWGGRVISTIAVIQPATPVCKSNVAPVDSVTVTLRPPKTQGDSDFDGHGPRVRTRVDLLPSPRALTVRVFMRAKETKSDYSTAEGDQTFPVYTPPPGWEIENLVEPRSMNPHTYTDGTVDRNDDFNLGGGPVKRLLFVGDTSGDDAGVKTQVTVSLNRLHVQLTQVGNCVSDTAARAARAQELLDDGTFNRLKVDVDRQVRQRQAMLKAIER